MRDRLSGLLEKADLALASCSGVVADSVLDSLIESVRRVRTRLAYPESLLVVAFAGGTGSGKSSLFNAVAGEDLVDASGVRPTTRHPAAALPESAAAWIDGYLDELGVEERHTQGVEGFCLLDLPDTDSVESAHHHRVDAVLPLVDVVVWVTDPEKYHDARLHHGYLRPLARYAGQFVFVVNQIDRLTAAQAEEVVADLGRALTRDGLTDPIILTTAAAPPAGPPMGIEALLDALERKRGEERALYGKLIADLSATTEALEAATGVAATDFDERAALVLQRATTHLVDDDVDAATAELVAFVDEVARETPGPAGTKIERIGGDVPQHVLRIASETEPDVPRRWFGRASPSPERDGERIRSLIKEAVLRPVRAVLAKRALARASVAELAVEVASLGSRSSR